MNKKTVILIIIVAVLIGIIVWVIINRQKKKREIEVIEKIIDENINLQGGSKDLPDNPALDPTYHKSYSFSDQDIERAKEYAQKIYDALGYFQIDDAQAVYEVIKSAKTKAFFSLITDQFYQMFNKSLLSHLDHLSEEEMELANSYIQNLN